VAAAAVIGRQVAIRPKRADDWTVIPNLWGLAVGRPGLMKSAALAEALKPLQPLIADARIAYERELLALERERQRALLNRRGDDEAGVADARPHGLGQIQRRELQRAHAAGVSSEAGAAAGSGVRFRPKMRAQMMPTS
jgi:hypothetical protein